MANPYVVLDAELLGAPEQVQVTDASVVADGTLVHGDRGETDANASSDSVAEKQAIDVVLDPPR